MNEFKLMIILLLLLLLLRKELIPSLSVSRLMRPN